MNSTDVNIHIQHFLWSCVFIFLECMPRSVIAESYINSLFNLLRSCQTVLQGGCVVLHSYLQCVGTQVSVYLHP